MSEMDLIPQAYRRRLRIKRWLRGFGAAYLGLWVAVLGLRLAFGSGIAAEAAELERIRQSRTEVMSHKMQLQTLRDRIEFLDQRLAVLGGLTRGPASQTMLQAVDRALDPGIGFTQWQFSRAGELVEPAPKAEHHGYFIVVPAGPGNAKPQAWQVQTHMEISGQAVDHGTLAGFVRRLNHQPEFHSVRLLNTRTLSRSGGESVHFELVIVVDGEAPA